jgi:hypothetical protein
MPNLTQLITPFRVFISSWAIVQELEVKPEENRGRLARHFLRVGMRCVKEEQP